MIIESHGLLFEIKATGFYGHDDDAEAAKWCAETKLRALDSETIGRLHGCAGGSAEEDRLFAIGADATRYACRRWSRQPEEAGVEIVPVYSLSRAVTGATL
ncbi:MAG: hypothetical protein ACREDU_01935 [Methylocella sp.]